MMVVSCFLAVCCVAMFVFLLFTVYVWEKSGGEGEKRDCAHEHCI